MSNLDGTGPNGQGPKTGAGRGVCKSFFSRCFNCKGFCGKWSLEEKKEFLKKELDSIQEEENQLNNNL